jgi:hypothetical protein
MGVNWAVWPVTRLILYAGSPAKKNAGILASCSLGMKICMRVLFAVFHSYIERLSFYTQVEKLEGAKHISVNSVFSSTNTPSAVQLSPDAMSYIPRNICNCCSDACFEFIHFIHCLDAHLAFHTAPKKTFQGRKIRRMRATQLVLLFKFQNR